MTDRLIAFLILCLMFSFPLGVAVVFTGEVILDFVFFWPLFMSALWISGGLYFWLPGSTASATGQGGRAHRHLYSKAIR